MEASKHILTKSIWVSGKPGIGKSELLRHTLIENKVDYIYVDLSLCDSVEEMICQIYETSCEYYGKPTENGNAKFAISALSDLLNSVCENGIAYIMIEEIPFERNSEQFHDFVRRLSQMVIYISTHAPNKARFILSSIAIPLEALDTYRDKIENQIHFMPMDDWTETECFDLVNLLCKAVDLNWESEDLKVSFVKKVDYSPRRIKSILKTCCSLDYRTITSEIIEKLLLR